MRQQLRKQAANVRVVAGNTHFITIDFDAIADPACRAAYHGIETSWALSDAQLDELNLMGEALLQQDRSFGKAMQALNATPPVLATVPQACAILVPRG